MSAHRSFARPGILGLVVLLMSFDAATATADEFWVAPTSQQDVGGLQIASNGFWPVTPVGAVRFAFSVPNNLLTFQSAKVVLIPHAPGGAATLNVFVCPAQNGGAVVGACAGPIAQPFTGVTNQLAEVDITAAVAPKVGTPGATYLAVVAYTTPTTTTDHVVGLRFRYAAVPPANVATLGANTFTGIQTAPGFVGDGSNVTGVNATLLDGLDSTAFALTAHGHDVSQVTNAARLVGGNTMQGTQTIDDGNIDLDNSSSTTGSLTKSGERFLHNFGLQNTFLGLSAGNVSMGGFNNTAIGHGVLNSNTGGTSNTAGGAFAMFVNTDGTANTAHGFAALGDNTTGSQNTATGYEALRTNLTGHDNTAVGYQALWMSSGGQNTAVGRFSLGQIGGGTSNVAVGNNAGSNSIGGSSNIYLGANVSGAPGESNAIYIGNQGTHTKAVIGGIRGSIVSAGEMVLIDAAGRLGSAPIAGLGPDTVGSAQVIDNSLTAADLGPDSVGTSELAPDSVSAAKVAFNYAASTSEGGAAANAELLDGLDSTAFARLTANTFTATQTIDSGNLDLDASTATTGNITKNGTRFLHNFGSAFNLFLGEDAGNFTMTGANNTGVGRAVLSNNTTGFSNTAMGLSALFTNTTGVQNAALGWSALSSNLGGGSNAAFGFRALTANVNGGGNVAVGADALRVNSIGSNNVGIGFMAGVNATGVNNIYLGANVFGVAGEANTIYIGNQGTQSKTTIAGIRGTVVAGGEMVVIDVNGRLGSTVLALSNAVGSAQVIDNSLTSDDLGPNSVGDSEVAFNYAGSASKGGAASNLACAGCVDATEVSFSYAGFGANTFAGAQTIDGGNLDLDSPSSTGAGTITKDGVRFLYETGGNRTFLGMLAGSLTSTGIHNTGLGTVALSNITTGESNTGVGSGALSNTADGSFNTAAGTSALYFNTSGSNNTADGWTALHGNTAGSDNTATGYAALKSNTSGGANVALGYQAGINATTGSNNIYIGANVVGTAGESNTIYVGLQGVQTRTLVAGIRGITTDVADAVPVVIDSNGQLGTVSSSRRFKENIQDMADASDRLFRLHPVTFRYTKPYANGSQPIQFGLIAEEVADVFPELAVRNADGVIETVHYETLNVLLLNEVQKQKRELEAQRDRIATLERRLNELIAKR